MKTQSLILIALLITETFQIRIERNINTFSKKEIKKVISKNLKKKIEKNKHPFINNKMHNETEELIKVDIEKIELNTEENVEESFLQKLYE